MSERGPTSSELASAVAALGRGFDASILAATRRIYATSVKLGVRPSASVRQDLAYGTHPRQVLDVFGPDSAPGVVLFLHGGGFTAGNKRSDAQFYSNVGHFFAEAGFQTVLANYRLAPDACWPSGIEDVRSAVQWIVEHLGDDVARRPIVLFGQSAGAAHAAGYVFDESTFEHASTHLDGCVLMSGAYRMDDGRSAGARAYYGSDAAVACARAPIERVRPTPVPLLITVSELDPPEIAWHGFDLAKAVTRSNGSVPAFLRFAGHNHVSTLHSLGSAQETVGRALIDFVRSCVDGDPASAGRRPS